MTASAFWIDTWADVASYVNRATSFDSYAWDDENHLQMLIPNKADPSGYPSCNETTKLPIAPSLIMVHGSFGDMFDKATSDPNSITKPTTGWKIFLYSTAGNPAQSDKASLKEAIRILRPIGDLGTSDFQELTQYALQKSDLPPRCCRPLRPDFTIATAIAVRGYLLLFKEPSTTGVTEHKRRWIFHALGVAGSTELQEKLRADGHSYELAKTLADQAGAALSESCTDPAFSERLKGLLEALENALQ